MPIMRRKIVSIGRLAPAITVRVPPVSVTAAATLTTLAPSIRDAMYSLISWVACSLTVWDPF